MVYIQREGMCRLTEKNTLAYVSVIYYDSARALHNYKEVLVLDLFSYVNYIKYTTYYVNRND